MRNTDEQFEEILNRAGKLRQKQKFTRKAALDALAACVCIALIVFSVGQIRTMGAGGAAMGQNFGSVVFTGRAAGMVIIALLAFALGVFVTLLCIHIRQAGKR